MKCELKKRMKPLLCFCRDNRRTLALLLGAVVLIAALQTAGLASRSSSYIKSKNGKVTAVRIQDPEEGISIPLRIEAEKDGVRTTLDVIQKPARRRLRTGQPPLRRQCGRW